MTDTDYMRTSLPAPLQDHHAEGVGHLFRSVCHPPAGDGDPGFEPAADLNEEECQRLRREGAVAGLEAVLAIIAGFFDKLKDYAAKPQRGDDEQNRLWIRLSGIQDCREILRDALRDHLYIGSSVSAPRREKAKTAADVDPAVIHQIRVAAVVESIKMIEHMRDRRGNIMSYATPAHKEYEFNGIRHARETLVEHLRKLLRDGPDA